MAARQASRSCARCMTSPSAAVPAISLQVPPWRWKHSYHLSSRTHSDLIRSLQQPGGAQTARSRPSQKHRLPSPSGGHCPQQPTAGSAQASHASVSLSHTVAAVDSAAADATSRFQPQARSLHRKRPQTVSMQPSTLASPTELRQPVLSSATALELQQSVGQLLQAANKQKHHSRMYGVGCDVAQIDRFRHLLCDPAVSSRFIAKMMHPEEIDAAAGYVSDAMQVVSDPFAMVADGTADEALVQRLCLYVARCWAVKEAIVKASGQRLLYPQIILHKRGLKPAVRYTGKAGNFITSQHLTTHVSLSHDGGMVMAVVVLEQVPQVGPTDQKLPQARPSPPHDDASTKLANGQMVER